MSLNYEEAEKLEKIRHDHRMKELQKQREIVQEEGRLRFAEFKRKRR